MFHNRNKVSTLNISEINRPSSPSIPVPARTNENPKTTNITEEEQLFSWLVGKPTQGRIRKAQKLVQSIKKDIQKEEAEEEARKQTVKVR